MNRKGPIGPSFRDKDSSPRFVIPPPPWGKPQDEKRPSPSLGSSSSPPIAQKMFYWVLVILCVSCGGMVYVLWHRSFEQAHPRLAAAHPFVYSPVMKVRALKLWWEEPLENFRGSLSQRGRNDAIRRVKKGDKLSPGLRAPYPGFVVPWQDGLEEQWIFSSLWRHEASMERAYTLQKKDGFPKASLKGKIVKLPQKVRLMLRLPRTPEVERMLRSGTVAISSRREPPFMEGIVQTERHEGSYACILVSLPDFPQELLLSRVGAFYISFPEQRGVLIPQSAVDFRNRKEGVYLVTGGDVRFREVVGKPVDNTRYLVEKGLLPGELVMENAQIAKEGRLRIW